MIARHKGEVPFLIYLLPFITGILLAFVLPKGLGFVPCVIFVVAVLAFMLLNVFYKRLGLYRYAWLGGVLAQLVFLLGGMIIVQLKDTRNAPNYFAAQAADQLLVRIDAEPYLKNKYWHFSAEVSACRNNNITKPASGKLMLTILADSAHQFNYGDELLIPANYKPVDAPFNPAAFNYKNYLANKHIYQQSFLFPGQYRLLQSHTGNPLIARSLKLRQQLAGRFAANMRDTDAAAVATTLVLGYKANLSPDVVKVYSKTGTIHVLSVSGAHVAIVYVFINFLLGFLGISARARWLKSALTPLLIWAYAMLTGFSPAVCRAAVMLSAVIIGRSGYRHVNQLNLLAFSAFILLLYDPLLIADIGFQLSYLAVFGLVVLQPVIFSWLHVNHKWLQKLWYLVSASLAAQVITFPLSAFYFHQFPLYFLVSNLLIIIPSELSLFFGILATVFGNVKFIGYWLYQALQLIITGMNRSLAFIERQPFASVDRIWFTGLECALLFIVIITFFYFVWNKRAITLIACLTCLLLLSVSFTVKRIKAGNTNQIVFFNISKHMAILFKQGDEGKLITDVNPADQNYNYYLKPAADSLGIDNISVYRPEEDTGNTWFKKQGHLMQYRDKTILLFDKDIENFIPQKPINVSYLYLYENPQTSVGFLKTYYKFNLLIIDPTNSPATIKRLSDEAGQLKINLFVLKRNKSLIMLSK